MLLCNNSVRRADNVKCCLCTIARGLVLQGGKPATVGLLPALGTLGGDGRVRMMRHGHSAQSPIRGSPLATPSALRHLGAIGIATIWSPRHDRTWWQGTVRTGSDYGCLGGRF